MRTPFPCLAAIALLACSSSPTPAGSAGTGADAKSSDAADANAADAASDAFATDTRGSDTLAVDVLADTSAPDVPPTPSPQLPEAKTWAAKYFDALCKADAKCDPYNADPDPARCKALVDLFEESNLHVQLEAMKVGKAKFDAKAAADCLKLLDTCAWHDIYYMGMPPGSGYVGKIPLACATAIAGLGKNGAACETWAECAGGDCDFAGAKNAKCPGKCANLAGAGGKCDSADDCADGLLCGGDQCVSQALGKKGDDCAVGGLCEPALTCSEDDEGAWTCDDKFAKGDDCGPGYFECAASLWCKPANAAMDEGACAVDLAAAATCDLPGPGTAADAWEEPCAAGHRCLLPAGAKGAKGKCLPESKPGAACTVDAQCQGPESWCEGAEGKAGKCALLPDKGKACAVIAGEEGGEEFCRQPYVCNPKGKLCIEAPGAGQPCISGYCNFELWCDPEEKCKPWGKKGDICETYDDASDTCDDGFLCGPADKCVELICK